jgi:Tfp pilus assembly protein PilO
VNGRRAPIIAGVAVAFVALVTIMFLVLPKMHAVSSARQSLDKAQGEQSSLQSQLQSLQDAQAAAPETQRQISAVEDQIPPEADLPALFLQLTAAADRSAVDFFSFSPGTPAVDASGTYSTLSSQITVTGGYFAVDEFLFLLETLPRAAKVTNITLAPGGGAGTTTTGTGTTTTTEPTATPSELSLAATVEFYTTDTSAGPGSDPGPSKATGASGATGVVAPTGATAAAPTGTT